jgi:transposase InsO family protein
VPPQLIETWISIRGGGKWERRKAIVDGGSQVNLLPRSLLSTGEVIEGKPLRMEGVFGTMVQSLGQKESLIEVEDDWKIKKRQVVSWEVVAEGDTMILGLPWLEKTNPHIDWARKTWNLPLDRSRIALVSSRKELRRATQESNQVMVLMLKQVGPSEVAATHHPPEALPPPVTQVPSEYADFADLFDPEAAGELPAHHRLEHRIELEEGKLPPYIPIYSLADAEQKELRKYLEEALRRGWIRSSRSSAGAPILFVPKKGGKLRLCVDYRGLNKITKKDRTPLPLINEILDRLSSAENYTKLDLKDAYRRLRIREGDEWKTAFRTKYGHFEYLVMPFGLANAPATFQTYINHALVGLVDTICVVYLDDILIYSRKGEDHPQLVRRVLERLREWGLYVNLSKCDFGINTVSFLGFIIGPKGVQMDREKTDTITSWPEPSSVHDIMVFLGFAGFYRRFVRKYSHVVAPLTDRQRGQQPARFKLTPVERAAFCKLRILFTRAPILRHYDPTLPIRVETDASNFAIGAVLSQQYEGRWHPVAFLSRKLVKAELRYTTPDAELLAIVYAFDKWRHYLAYSQHPIHVLTDHLNHRYLATKPQLSTGQASWMQRLSPYDFHIEFRPGSSNPADGISRRPDYYHPTEKQEARDQLLPSFLQRFTNEQDDYPPSIELASSPEGIVGGLPNRSAPLVDELISSEAAAITLGRQGIRSAGALIAAVHVSPRRRKRTPEVGTSGPASAEAAGHEPLPRRPEGVVTALEELDEPLLTAIRKAQQGDAFVQNGEWQQRRSRYHKAGPVWAKGDDEILRYRGRVYIPDFHPLEMELLRSCHDDPTAGHMGISKTIKRLSQSYYWNRMTKDVTKHVLSCSICQRTKARHHLPYGKLASLPVPTEAWAEISFDFITGLPESRTWGGRRCNSVLVIVDRLTKYALYIPTRNDLTATGLADILYARVFMRFGVPEGIVSDRGSLFTSKFWATLCHHLAIKRRLSTAYHPQTDGQTERVNQSLEHYLRTYCCYEQNDWVEKLPMAEWVYNTSIHSAHGQTPAMTLRGYQPRGPSDPPSSKPPARAKKAEERAEQIRRSREHTQTLLKASNEAYAKWYNRKKTDMTFSVGQQVLVNSKHINQRRPHRKLADKYLGPFPIIDIIGGRHMAYKVNLPERFRIHPTFPVSFLEPWVGRDGEVPVEQNVAPTEGVFYDLEEILGHRGYGKKREYLIRWKNCSIEDDSWEPRSYLAKGLAKEYEDTLKRDKEVMR